MPSTTSNMSLSVPLVGESTYPTSTSDSYTAIDTHDHSSGKGVQIVTGGITDLAVTTAKLANASVSTAKIIDASVTKAKLATTIGQQVSSVSTGLAITSTSAVDVTNLTITITTTGRPVFISIAPVVTVLFSAPAISLSSGSDAGAQGNISILRGATNIANSVISFNHSGVSGSSLGIPPNIVQLDAVAAGTYTYKVQAFVDNAAHSLTFTDCVLIAFEL